MQQDVSKHTATTTAGKKRQKMCTRNRVVSTRKREREELSPLSHIQIGEHKDTGFHYFSDMDTLYLLYIQTCISPAAIHTQIDTLFKML